MPYPTLPKDPSLIPISSIYIPGTGWVALQGTTPTTDGLGNPSAPLSAALYGKAANPGDTALLVDAAGRMLVNSTARAGIVALTSPPANTNAGSETLLTFSQQVNHFLVQNTTPASVYVEPDTTATTGSVLLVPGTTWEKDVQVTVLHVYTAAAQPVNGASGIIVRGWL